jgi:OsmC subfamily peroxiredoxin
MQRKGSAVWTGGLKDGKGTVSTETGTLKDTQYSFAARFENGAGTNPEELLAAAHAGCFSMALSGQLGAANLKADRIATTATTGNPGFDTQEKVGGQAVNEPGDFGRWADDWASQHEGRISRQAYMDEMGRRWDAMDHSRQGLTPREVSAITGHPDSNALPAATGSGVQPGNMGPGNSRK